MCGIAGVVYRDRHRRVDEEALTAMRDAQTHRGPDDCGNYVGEGVGLASRRLAILDLSPNGHMPMSTADGRYHIVYNGEVYNFDDFRAELEGRGYRFHSRSDTEVLLYLYVEYGPTMLERLNGMFGLAIWDTVERSLFIARDRLGIKPLYYRLDSEGLFFSSEAKGLFAGGVQAEFDPGCWEEMLCFRFTAGEETPFKGVKRLLPGHWLRYKDGDLTIRRWWNLADRARTLATQLPSNPLEWYESTFEDAIRLRRISDVPVGVLLSGGLDSSSVAASLGRQAGDGVASFTVRFREKEYDEGPLAKEVAEQFRLAYHELYLDGDELIKRLDHSAWLNDEPLVHGSDPHILAISQYAKPKVTVLLSGEGADELMGGYVRYQPLRYTHLLSAARPLMPLVGKIGGGRFAKLARFAALGGTDSLVLHNACDVLPPELETLGFRSRREYPYRHQVLEEAQALYPGEPFRQAMYSDQHTFLCSVLDRNDRMTMGASMECRVPFLDYRLVEGLAALPSSEVLKGRKTKRLLRDTIARRLPETVQQGRKWGFGVPWADYLRHQPVMREIVESLPQLEPIASGPFDKQKLRSTIDAFIAGDSRHTSLIRQLFMVALWRRNCFEPVRRPGRALTAV